MSEPMSVEEAVRQTLEHDGIGESASEQREAALVAIVELADDFGYRRSWRSWWEGQFAHRYVCGLGFAGQAGLLVTFDLSAREGPWGGWRSVAAGGADAEEIAPGEAVYLAAAAWVERLVKGVFARLGKG